MWYFTSFLFIYYLFLNIGKTIISMAKKEKYMAKQIKNRPNKILLNVIIAAVSNTIQSIASVITKAFLIIEIAFLVVRLIIFPPLSYCLILLTLFSLFNIVKNFWHHFNPKYDYCKSNNSIYRIKQNVKYNFVYSKCYSEHNDNC